MYATLNVYCLCCDMLRFEYDYSNTTVFSRGHKRDIGISDVNDILGTTKDTPTETMRLMLDLPPMQTRQKVEQVKAYFSVLQKSE